MDTIRQDLRCAWRRLFSDRAFTSVALLTLALGIGANTAIFSVVYAVLLKPLPFDDPDRLVGVFHVWEDKPEVMSPPNFLDARAQSRTLEDAAAFDKSSYALTGAGEPVNVEGASVSASFFAVLRARPLFGRTFREDENTHGKHRVVVLSHALWQQYFGGDREVIGRAISLDGGTYEVVGVTRPGFGYPAGSQLWVPFEYGPMFAPENRGAWFLSVIGRLRPGTTVDEAQAELATIGKRLEQQYPEKNTGVGMTVRPLREAIVGQSRPALLILLGAVGLVLLIACANVANLLLSRGAAREGELAVRAALGASRGRLVRQLLTESALLGVAGGVLGLLIAAWGQATLLALQPEGIPRLGEVTISGPVLAFNAAVAVATGLIFGAVPALQVTRRGPSGTLRESNRSVHGGRRARELRGLLVVAETALAVVLLVGAGLLLRSFVLLQRVDPGFRVDNALALRLGLPSAKYGEDVRVAAFFDTLLTRVGALPGVRSAGAVMGLPLTDLHFNLSFDVQGRPRKPFGQEDTIEIRVATPGYFSALGIPLKRGRLFTARDVAGAPQVTLITHTAARRFFPGEDPIGKHITVGWRRGEETSRAGGEVIGIVADVKDAGLAMGEKPQLYLPLAQWPVNGMDVVLRTDVPPLSVAEAVRAEIRSMDADLPITWMRTLDQLVSRSIAQPRFYTTLLGAFAGMALLLASVGIFGVLSYAVAQRTREIGIRVALGAERTALVTMVVRDAMMLAGLGLLVGLGAALALSRTLATMLFGLTPRDPLTFAAVPFVLGLVALVATCAPALRAARLDPVVALRTE